MYRDTIGVTGDRNHSSDTGIENNEWNDVIEKLPDDDIEFYDVYDGENVLVMPHAYYKNSGWMPYDSPKVNSKITHYRKRPGPPKLFGNSE